MKKRTWIAVVSAKINESHGRSLVNTWVELGNVWELVLEDGREITYPVRYKKQDIPGNQKRRGWTHRRYAEDALPPPKRVLY